MSSPLAVLLLLTLPAAAADGSARAAERLAQARKLLADSQGTGLRLMLAMEERGVRLDVWPTEGETCQHYLYFPPGGGRKDSITCHPRVADFSARYAAMLVAEVAGALRWRDFPDCAEKDFMVASLMSRAWLEAGGQLSRLPAFDGRLDRARAARIKAWLSRKLQDHARAAAAEGKTTLGALLAEKRRELAGATCASEERALLSEIAELEAFREQAKAFSREEAEWAQQNWRFLPRA